MADIDGTSRQDLINGTTAFDTISGGDGSDRIFGGPGNDLIYGHSASTDESITAALVASGLSDPVFAASPPGQPNRLFIVEQHTGRIMILDTSTGQLNPAPFLDLADSSLAVGGEQGLLGLAFHPDYPSNGIFYVNLTNAVGDTEIRAYRAVTPDRADPASANLILRIDQPFPNHNGGWMDFGRDGFLYIATGDGGGSGDPFNNAQNINSLLGKIIRIDVNGDDFPTDPNRNYRVPFDNPFIANLPGADEVWLYGLRNPWRASFDSVTGDLWIGDVGQGAREEVDFIPAGQKGLNLGWDLKEGFAFFSGFPGNTQGLTDPILDYDRSSLGGFAVTGGYVYHGPGGANGLYVFADFGSGNLWTVTQFAGQAQDFINRNAQVVITGGGDLDLISSFAVDGVGRLYAIGLDGDIHRLTPGAASGDGMDYLRGEEGNDSIFGGYGFDDINGNTGNDTLSGGNGADWVVGGQHNDSVSGDEGDDIVYGNLGDDTCAAGPGADLIRGGQGNDDLRAGLGDDWISGDLGDDSLIGGPGADIFNSFGDAGLDRVLDFSRAEGDRVRLDPGSTYAVSQQGADTVVEITGGARVVLVGVSLASLTGDWIFVG